MFNAGFVSSGKVDVANFCEKIFADRLEVAGHL